MWWHCSLANCGELTHLWFLGWSTKRNGNVQETMSCSQFAVVLHMFTSILGYFMIFLGFSILCSIIPTFNPVLPPINLAELQEFTHLKIAAIIRPFGDDSPNPNHCSSDVTMMSVSFIRKYTITYNLVKSHDICHLITFKPIIQIIYSHSNSSREIMYIIN